MNKIAEKKLLENEKFTLSWDETTIIEDKVKYIKEVLKGNEESFENFEECKGMSDDELFNHAATSDPYVFQHEWVYVRETMDEILKNLDYPSLIIDLNNFGWRHSDGQGTIKPKDGEEFFSKILPNTQCTWTMELDIHYDDPFKTTFTINNAHHDAPMGGELYYITIGEECSACGDIYPHEELKDHYMEYDIMYESEKENREGKIYRFCEECYNDTVENEKEGE